MKYDGPPIHYKRRVFASDDKAFAGHFAVDFVTKPPPAASGEKDAEGNLKVDEGLKEDPVGVGDHGLPPRTTYFTDEEFNALGSAEDEKPLLIMLHGLSGGSYETYLRHVLEPMVEPSAAGEKAGGISGGEWEAIVVNSRGCAGSKITSSILYNARATWDVRQVVKWARQRWPKRKMFGIGFSLGANIMTNVSSPDSILLLLLHFSILTHPVVPWRRRRLLPSFRGSHRLQPMETRSVEPGPAAHMDWLERLQQSHG